MYFGSQTNDTIRNLVFIFQYFSDLYYITFVPPSGVPWVNALGGTEWKSYKCEGAKRPSGGRVWEGGVPPLPG